MLPCITKRRITTNLKTINNQKCQKIKLHGTPTTKELKKHSPRPVGGVETISRVERQGTSEAGLAEREITDSKLTVNYCGGLPRWENLPVSHERVRWKVGLEQSKLVALSPL